MRKYKWLVKEFLMKNGYLSTMSHHGNFAEQIHMFYVANMEVDDIESVGGIDAYSGSFGLVN